MPVQWTPPGVFLKSRCFTPFFALPCQRATRPVAPDLLRAQSLRENLTVSEPFGDLRNALQRDSPFVVDETPAKFFSQGPRRVFPTGPIDWFPCRCTH